VSETGTLNIEAYRELFNERTRFVSCVWVSNSIGTVNPIDELIRIAHSHSVPFLVDACQAAPHMKIDVQALNCDFLAFSGHKVFAPTGIGVLYGRESLLEAMPPYQSGGDMIRTVTYQKSTFADPPHKFEAGTPHIAGAVGLAEAMKYIENIGRYQIEHYEQSVLLPALRDALQKTEGVKMVGRSRYAIPAISFVADGAHPLDIGTMLDFEGVAVRTGHHCTQPLLNQLGVSATCRASLAFYNTLEEIEYFGDALSRVLKKLRK
jgi:cysteine desulfurase/selenocysteine lyase